MGRCSYGIGRNNIALAIYREALKKLPKKADITRAEVHAWRSDIYSDLGDTLKAYREIEQAVRLNPQSAAHLNKRCVLAFETGNTTQAEADCRRSMTLDETSTTPFLNLCALFLETTDYHSVCMYADKGLEKDSTEISFPYMRMQAKFKMKDYASAAYDLALCYHLSDEEQQIDLSDWTDSIANKDFRATKDALEAALSRWPQDTYAYVGLATACQRTLRPKSALAYCRKYQQAYGTTNWYVNTMVLSLFSRMDDSAGGLAEAERLIAADSTDTGLYDYYYAFALRDCGQDEAAIKVWNRQLEVSPTNYALYLGRYYSLRDCDRTTDALKDARHAAALAPEDAESQLALGRILLRTGHAEEAQQHLLEAVRLDSIPRAGSDRLFALYYLNRRDEARAWCEKMIAAETEKVSEGQQAQPEPFVFYYAARLYTLLGENECAVQLLRQAFENNMRGIPYIESDSYFETLHDMAAFKALMDEYRHKEAQWQ